MCAYVSWQHIRCAPLRKLKTVLLTSTDVGSQNISRAQTALASETEVDIGNWEAEFSAQKLEGREEEGERGSERKRKRIRGEIMRVGTSGSWAQTDIRDGSWRHLFPMHKAKGSPVQNCFNFHIFTCSCLHPFRHIYVHIFSEEKNTLRM